MIIIFTVNLSIVPSQAAAGAFLTLTDFGKNLTGWAFDKNGESCGVDALSLNGRLVGFPSWIL